MSEKCKYAIRIKGTAEAIKEMENRLGDPNHRPHFNKVLDVERTDVSEDVAEFRGYCERCPRDCLCYRDENETAATTLQETAAELHAEIEMYGEDNAGEDSDSLDMEVHVRLSALGEWLEDEQREADFCLYPEDFDSFEEFEEAYPEECATFGLTEDDYEQGYLELEGWFASTASTEWEFSI